MSRKLPRLIRTDCFTLDLNRILQVTIREVDDAFIELLAEKIARNNVPDTILLSDNGISEKYACIIGKSLKTHIH